MTHTRIFRSDDQQQFATLSGDSNPIHLDQIQARRLMFGKTVVHGIHLLMWALDSLLSTRPSSCRVNAVNATFRKPVFPGDQVTLKSPPTSEASMQLQISSLSEVKAQIEVEFSQTNFAPARTNPPHPEAPSPQNPRILPDDSLVYQQGNLSLYLPQAEYQGLFPNLARWMDPLQASTLLAISRLAGVECPGLNSILYGITLKATALQKKGGMDYRVTAFDERMKKLSMAIESPLLSGNMTAFVRPGPVNQANCLEIDQLVEDGEFSDQNALVVGASRGLGEVTAKLLSMGGAEVTGTFNRGIADAERIRNEARSAGKDIQFIQLDVTSNDFLPLLASQGVTQPTHLYYFCSPRIPMDQTGAFSTESLDQLFQIYVVRFIELVVDLAGSRLGYVFYPSTVALNEIPLGMREYSIAKSAGETACKALEKSHPDLQIHQPRLPRMATDQTASILPAKTENAPEIMLAHLRELSSLQDEINRPGG